MLEAAHGVHASIRYGDPDSSRNDHQTLQGVARLRCAKRSSSFSNGSNDRAAKRSAAPPTRGLALLRHQIRSGCHSEPSRCPNQGGTLISAPVRCGRFFMASAVGELRHGCHKVARRDARAAEWTGLENRRGATHRGFKSHSLRSLDFASSDQDRTSGSSCTAKRRPSIGPEDVPCQNSDVLAYIFPVFRGLLPRMLTEVEDVAIAWPPDAIGS